MNQSIPRSLPVLFAAFVLLGGCGAELGSDAYGNFEATEITVSAQADGRLMTFDVLEGDNVIADQAIGQIDSTQLAARRDMLAAQVRQLEAQQQVLVAQEEAARLQIGEARAQVEAFQSQYTTAVKERDRTRQMLASGAATERELSDFEGRVSTL